MPIKRLTLTPFSRLNIGKHFYASNEKTTTFKKTSKDTWCVVLKDERGKVIKTRDNKAGPDELVLI